MRRSLRCTATTVPPGYRSPGRELRCRKRSGHSGLHEAREGAPLVVSDGCLIESDTDSIIVTWGDQP